MKKILLTAAIAMGIATTAQAQFKAGTKYVGASVSGLSLNYSKTAEFNLGLNAEAGYYFADGWMAKGNFGYNHAKTLDGLTIGAGVRYSFRQNGIFLGAGLEYAFDKYSTETTYYTTTVTKIPVFDDNGDLVLDGDGKPLLTPTTEGPVANTTTTNERVNNIRIPIEIGYTFYLNHYLAVEPAIYTKMSLNHFSEGTEFGLKIGLGFYFDRLYKSRKW